jgi:hypothetical protein
MSAPEPSYDLELRPQQRTPQSDLDAFRQSMNAQLLSISDDLVRREKSYAALLAAARAAFPVMTVLMRQIPSTHQDYEANYKCLDALQAAIFHARDIES